MTPRKAKRTERKPPCNNAQCTQMLVDAGGEIQNVRSQRNRFMREAEDLRTALSQAQKERDDAFKRANDYCVERNAADVTLSKRDIAIADLNAELREKDATISGLREIEGKLNARVGDAELQLQMADKTIELLRADLQDTRDRDDELFAQQREHLVRLTKIINTAGHWANHVAGFYKTTRHDLFGTRCVIVEEGSEKHHRWAQAIRIAIAELAVDTALPKPEGAK